MDLLTHIFLPLAALYVLKREMFNPCCHFLLASFAILPDFDKFSFSFLNAPIQLVYAVPRTGFNTYGILSGFGVASLVLFVMVYVGTRKR